MHKSTLQAKLAALTHILIYKLGGFVSAALECDVSKSQLHRAADAHHSYSLKASTIYHLEQACGEPIISRALFDLVAPPANKGFRHPVYIGVDLSAEAGSLTVALVEMLEDGKITLHEHQIISKDVYSMRKLLAEITQSVDHSKHMRISKSLKTSDIYAH
jgi:hypothetical protein